MTKRIVAVLCVLVSVFTFSVGAFAEAKVVDKNIVFNDNGVKTIIPMQFSYDKVCYLVDNKDGVAQAKYCGTYTNGWQNISLDEYCRKYKERQELHITY